MAEYDIEDELDGLDIALSGLKPETAYRVFVCAESTQNRKSSQLSARTTSVLYDTRTLDAVVEDHHIAFTTVEEPPEVMDIEWGRLNEPQRDAEVRAAARSFAVQIAAKAENIVIPTDEEISNRNKPAQVPTLKKWKTFVAWWTGGDENLGYSAVRIAFQSEEILHAASKKEHRDACFRDGYLSSTEFQRLNSIIMAEDAIDDDKSRISQMPTTLNIDPAIFDDFVFNVFRSWFKGGRVVERQQFWNSPVRVLLRAKEGYYFLVSMPAYWPLIFVLIEQGNRSGHTEC